MIKKILKLLFSFGIIIQSKHSLAQENFLIPTNISVGFDFGKLLYYGALINVYNQGVSYSYKSSGGIKPSCPQFEGNYYEFNSEISFRKVIVDLDFGYGNPKWHGTKFAKTPYSKENIMRSEYSSKGFFFKYGFCYNFLIETDENNTAFLGVKHAISLFDSAAKGWVTHEYGTKYSNSPEARFPIEKEYISDKRDCPTKNLSQKNLFAHWFEIQAGVKLKIFDYLYIGTTFRYKFFLNIHKDKLFEPFEVPGWGKTNDKTSPSCFGFNFYLSLRIPLKKTPKYNRMDYKKKEDKISFMEL